MELRIEALGKIVVVGAQRGRAADVVAEALVACHGYLGAVGVVVGLAQVAKQVVEQDGAVGADDGQARALVVEHAGQTGHVGDAVVVAAQIVVDELCLRLLHQVERVDAVLAVAPILIRHDGDAEDDEQRGKVDAYLFVERHGGQCVVCGYCLRRTAYSSKQYPYPSRVTMFLLYGSIFLRSRVMLTSTVRSST